MPHLRLMAINTAYLGLEILVTILSSGVFEKKRLLFFNQYSLTMPISKPFQLRSMEIRLQAMISSKMVNQKTQGAFLLKPRTRG